MNDEQERLKRLRERQLADRDPHVKQRKSQRIISRRARRDRRNVHTLGQAWQILPHLYRTPLICALIGLGVIIALPYLWNSPLAAWVGVGVTLFLVLLGAAIGQALDLRDDLRDFSKDR